MASDLFTFDPSEQYRADKKISIMFESLAAPVHWDYSSYTAPEQESNLVHITGFKAFITGYSDTFTSDWTPTSVFGRNDPILNFKSTARNISLAFDVVAHSQGDAVKNLQRTSKLIQQLYPGYSAEAMGRTANITRPPLVKVKFAQLIADHSPEAGSSYKTGFGGTESPGQGGLIVAIKSISVTPNFDAGAFDGLGPAAVYPKVIAISMEFSPLHQGALGWDSNVLFMGDTESGGPWPYATDLNTYREATGETLGIGISAETEGAVIGDAYWATVVADNEAAQAEALQNNPEDFTDEQAGGSYGEAVEGEVSSDGAGYLGWVS